MRLFALAAALALPAAPALAEEPAGLQVYAEEAPPLSVVEDGTVRGPMAEAVRELLARAGQDSRIQYLPWARAYQTAADRPDTALFAVARTPERETSFHWIGELYATRTYVYRLASRTDIPAGPLEALGRYRIVMVRGSALYERLRRAGFPTEHICQITKPQQRIPMLQSGHVDLMTFNPVALDYFLQQQPRPLPVVPVATTEDEASHQYLVLNRKSRPALVLALRRAYEAMEREGRLAALKASPPVRPSFLLAAPR